MFYEFAVTTPANTPSTSPKITDVYLVAGVITWVEVQFPRGCSGLVHAAVRDKLHQVWPTNPDGNISGDDVHVDWLEHYELAEEPYGLHLVTWNNDDTFAHTLSFRFAETPAELVAKQVAALRALQYLDVWFSRQRAPTVPVSQ